jgi:hypothetical protein
MGRLKLAIVAVLGFAASVARGAPPPLRPGSAVELSRPGGAGNVPLAAEESLVPALSDQSEGGFGRYRQLLAEGKAVYLPNGTRGEVVAVGKAAARVRIAGPVRPGSVWWVESRFARVPPPDPEAVTLLKAGRNLEGLKKYPAALGYYRKVVKDFPGTPEAKAAAERVKALTVKP